jgi:chitin synthase
MFATIFLTVKSVQSELKHGFKVSDLIKNKTFSTLILSMLSTYVLWFVVSFLFFDAWHMFTSFLQYLLLTPSYINVLNVYALCNTHDLSWGTKGSNDAPGGGSAKSGKDGKVEVSVPHPDVQYGKELTLLATPFVEEASTANPDDVKKSYYATVRSGIVMAWIFSNLALVTLVMKAGSIGIIVKSVVTEEEAEAKNASTYLFVVLWSVAGLSAFRFIGSVWFLIHRKVSFPSYQRRVIGMLTPYSLQEFDLDYTFEFGRTCSFLIRKGRNTGMLESYKMRPKFHDTFCFSRL